MPKKFPVSLFTSFSLKYFTTLLILIVSVLMPASRAVALPPQDVNRNVLAQTTQTTLGEQLENLGRVYKDEENDILQELWLLGRYHGHYHYSQGSDGNDEAWETRRMRMGFQARAFRNLTLHAQMVSGSDVNPFYNGFTELWTQWAFSPEIALTVGQQKNRFTHDRNVSSRYLNYLERAMLTQMFGADYTPAVTLQGKISEFSYYTGIFSNATGTNMGDAFTELDSGYSYIGAGYYDFGKMYGTDDTTLYASYVHSNANQNATNLGHFDDGVSTALILTKGSGSLVTEVTGGFGNEAGNAVGINFQPGYFLTNKLQVVGRYQLASSNGDEGLSPQKRYEKPAGLPAGDLYQATYLGVNYYIAKHRLKVLNGVEYSSMGGEDVWTFSSMIRFYFGPHSGGAFPANQMLHGYFEHD